jgi:DnaJ-class molecular chaperone
LPSEDEAQQAADAQQAALYIDGHAYTIEDLSFEEEEFYQRCLKDLAPATPCRGCDRKGVIVAGETAQTCPLCGGDGEIDQTRERDYLVALITVVKRRSEPAFTLNEAKRYKRSDMKAPPTREPVEAL